MKIGKKIIVLTVFVFILLPVFTQAVSWLPIVPCGTSANPTPCNQCDLFKLLKNIIDFVLMGLMPPAAAILFVWGGFLILMGGANPGWITQGKSIFWNTAIGVAIILASWLITNTIIRSIAADNIAPEWWKFQCSVTTSPPPPVPPVPANLIITTTSLSDARQDFDYSQAVQATGGNTPYNWSISGGSQLPAGLTINGSTGEIFGKPTTAGTSTFTVMAEDFSSPQKSVSKQLSLKVVAPAASVVISNVRTGIIDSVSATIGWSTDKPSTSQVESGRTTSYDAITTVNSDMVLNHSVALTNLTPNTIYNYRAISTISGFTARSSNNTFRTTGQPPSNSCNQNFGLALATGCSGTSCVDVSNITPTHGCESHGGVCLLSSEAAEQARKFISSFNNLSGGSCTLRLSSTIQGGDGPSASLCHKPANDKSGSCADFNLLPNHTDCYQYFYKASRDSGAIVSFLDEYVQTCRPGNATGGNIHVNFSESNAMPPTPNQGGLSCNFSGVNLCQSKQTGCSVPSCSQYVGSINKYAGGAATANLLKSIMVNESSCNIAAVNGNSFGLMQIAVSTANIYKTRCGVTENINGAWLTNPANAGASICIGAEYIKSLSQTSCGSSPRHLAAGFNGGSGACTNSVSCAGDMGCDGSSIRKWECLYDDTAQTVCNDTRPTNYDETRTYVPKVLYCYNNPGF